MSNLEILGVGSAILSLIAFIGLEFGRLRANSPLYDGLNFLSGVGLFYYAYIEHVIPFVITNTAWTLVSAYDLTRSLRRRTATHA